MKKFYIAFFFMVVSIPFFLGLNAWQANKSGEIRREIRELEHRQENAVERNRAIAAEIADLIAVDNLELVAQRRLGLQKIRPENVRLIILGGQGHGL
jgi:cell division protein FtsL